MHIRITFSSTYYTYSSYIPKYYYIFKLYSQILQTNYYISKYYYNTPVFRKMHGDIGIDDWILTVENNMKMAQIPGTMKVNAVINYLKDTPFTLAKKHLTSGDWEALKTELKEVFKPFYYERKLQEKITYLNQGDRPFEVYLEQFSTLRYQLKLDDERALTIKTTITKTTQTKSTKLKESSTKTTTRDSSSRKPWLELPLSVLATPRFASS